MSDMLSVHVESVEAAFTFSFLLNDEERSCWISTLMSRTPVGAAVGRWVVSRKDDNCGFVRAERLSDGQ